MQRDAMNLADRRQRPPYLDVVRMLLDHPLLDSDYVECGKVDDVEVEIMDDGTLRATAIFTGPGAALEHLPDWAGWFARKIFGKRTVRLPWAEIALLEHRIKLRSTAEALKLVPSEQRVARWLAKIPRSQ